MFKFLIAAIFSTFMTCSAMACVNANAEYNILADGSDETAKIWQAFSRSFTEPVCFGPGVYGINNLPTFNEVPMVEMAGLKHTVFKNLSASVRAFEFAPHIAGDLKTAFVTFGNFTLDQNGSSGSGVVLRAMFSKVHDIWIYGQAGSGWAFDFQGTTEGFAENLLVSSSSNCARMYLVYYLRVDHFGCERTTGKGVSVSYSTAILFTSLYLDNGSIAGPSTLELLEVLNSHSITFEHLTSEIGDGATLSPLWYFKIANSDNVNITNGFVNHYATTTSKYIFHSSLSSLTISNFEWLENQPSMIFLGGNGNLATRDIRTNITTTGSRYSVGNWDGNATRVEMTNWHHIGNVPVSDVNAISCLPVYLCDGTPGY